MAFKFPCDMTEDERKAYHAKRFADERRAGAKRFGLKPSEVLFYNRGICYDRVTVRTKAAAEKVAASVEGDTVNGGYFDGMPLGCITETTTDGKLAYNVTC